MRRSLIFILLCGVLLFCNLKETHAIPVIGNFSGTFSSVTGKGDFPNEIKVGTGFFGGFTYNTDANIIFGGGADVIYDPSGFKIWLDIVGEQEIFRLYDTGAGGIHTRNSSQWGDVFAIPFIMSWQGDLGRSGGKGNHHFGEDRRQRDAGRGSDRG